MDDSIAGVGGDESAEPPCGNGALATAAEFSLMLPPGRQRSIVIGSSNVVNSQRKFQDVSHIWALWWNNCPYGSWALYVNLHSHGLLAGTDSL